MKLGCINRYTSLSLAISILGSFSGSSSAFALQALSISNLNPTVFAGDPNGNPADSATLRITNASQYDGIGSISVGCTGAAISPTHVLSAAHCFNPNSPNVSFRLGGNDYAGIVSIFPNAVFPFDDVAVITLGQSLPVSTPIYELYRNPIPLGSTVEFVGFGASGDGVNGNDPINPLVFDPNVKRLGFNVADYFYIEDRQTGGATLSITTRNALVGFDFDGNDASTSFSGGLTLGNALESTYGGGDSGSPNFINENGTLRIAGVSTGVFGVTFNNNTFNNPFFGSGGIFTDVSGFTGFIDGITGVTPVPFEFSPAIGIGLLGIWGVIAKLRKK